MVYNPYDIISCFGEGEYCGQFGFLDWPRGGWNDYFPVIVLVLLYAALTLVAYATSDGGPPKVPWLLRTNSYGFMWLPFLSEFVHHANSAYMGYELANPGSTPIGRVAHHFIDVLCHTTYNISMAVALKSACGKGLPSRASLLLLLVVRLFVENWEYGGVTYRLKWHEDGHTLDRPEYGDMLGFITPSFGASNIRTHGGKIMWGYTFVALVVFSFFSGVDGLWKMKASLVPQVALVILTVFHPAIYMIVGGNIPMPERTFGMNVGHLWDYFVWQTNMFIWFIIGPNKEWIEAYNGVKEKKV